MVADLFERIYIPLLILCLNLFAERGSEWRVVAFKRVEVHIGTYQPIQGRGYVPIPLELKYRHSLINIKPGKTHLKKWNNHCFHLCILNALHGKDILNQKIKQIEIKRAKQGKAPITARYRANLNKYILLNGSNYLSYLETSSIDFFQITVNDSKGVSIEDIRVFQEKRDISVNVYFNKGSYLKRILGTEPTIKDIPHLVAAMNSAVQHSEISFSYDGSTFKYTCPRSNGFVSCQN